MYRPPFSAFISKYQRSPQNRLSRKISLISALALSVILSAVIAQAEIVELTNKDGQTIRCKIEGMDLDSLKLRKEDGRLFTYPIDKLDDASKKVATLQVQRIYTPSLNVTSLRSSKRESSYVSLSGDKHRHVSKSRTFKIEVKTFCPLDTNVRVEWYYFSGTGKYSRSHKQGVVSSNTELEFEATQSTRWHGIDYDTRGMGRSIDSSSGSKKLDLVVLLKLDDGSIVRKYSTSKFAEDYIMEKFGN
ncbi:hypothetical protein [Rubellicoccus peritrichatus]|uniref:Uncharacterized protein n=1 Tax=Rubellicoccus peritrichatus TaxID=3080537 RepID=A0AAQ3LDW1_9BACT|nr:hypothetical protein [Puniceicoccus sp. CR14]WOO42115.1 hypothetical protein RZN69_03375 [Puniceicoccus sp. CR14]